MSANIDMESGESILPPMMHENPELRWSFIRKVYSIITFQLLLTIPVISLFLFVPSVANFFNSKQGTVLCSVLLFVPLITLCSLYCFHWKYPLNYFLLLIFNVSLTLPVGLTSTLLASGRKIEFLEVVILATAMMFILTLYTFWAAKKGHDFSYLGSFLFGSLSILILLSLIQILSPLGKLSHMIFGCLISIIFCGYLVLNTNYYIIKEYTYDQHVKAFVFLYIDVIIYLFMLLFFCYFL
ncbi:protein LIFEGUARD [Trifolium repens]|nr:protein LIFEGUARD [Trifolium repens]